MAKYRNYTLKNEISTNATFIQTYNELESLGCNVLNCTLQPYMDKTFFNLKLFYTGALAAFYDEEMKEILTLPFTVIGKPDVYGRPVNIHVYSSTGYSRYLKKDEFIIIYDNLMHKPLYPKVRQTAARLTYIRRTIDINIHQQKTPRIIQCADNEKMTIENLINEYDACDDAIKTYDSLDLNALNTIIMPAPYVADKLEAEYEKQYSDILRYMGVASVIYEKRERLIKDEVTLSQGGTVANRYNRFNSYKECFEKINERFEDVIKKPFEVEFYDGLPTTLQSPQDVYEDDENEDEEGGAIDYE